MSEQQSYRQIMKATSLFGGVQAFNIIISIISTKFIAVLLGPAGMGIVSLLNSTTGMISGMTNFGLGTSAVKDVAAANSKGNIHRVSTVVTVFRRMVWMTGLLGMSVTLILSPWLSQLTFGNKKYTLAFALISVTLLINQLSKGQSVVLQGMRKLQYLAKSNIIGAVLGLFITTPLYFMFGEKGIVPVIIITSIVTLSLTSFFARKIELEKVYVSKARTYVEGKSMLQMGFLISLSGLMVLGSSYVIRIFISRVGGIAEVGLFGAGFAIVNTYVGLIFSAMSTDYYPRLSSVAYDNALVRKTVNQQAEIAILILAPLLIIFLVFIHWVIVLLYSTKFIAIDRMIYWAALGIFFKAISWAIAFILLAKSDKKTFFYNELVANVYTLVLNLLGFYFMGLTGLGISFLLGYFIYLAQVLIMTRAKYQFALDKELVRLFIFQFTLAIASFSAVLFLPQPYPYLVGIVLIAISGWYSYRELDKRIGIRMIIADLVKKFKQR